MDGLTSDFKLKLVQLLSDPSSVYFFRQPYLQATARNFLRDEARKGRKVRAISGHCPDEQRVVEQMAGALGDVDALEMAELCHDLIATCDSEDVRLVLAGFTAEEIADTREISVSEAESRRHAVRDALRQRAVGPL
jgi:DNA-directed RNA polymerase specialized sigma24 family protein